MRLLLAFALLSGALAATAANAPRLYLAGDSTMANKPLDLPERGWGQALATFAKDPATVQNHAMNGRSTLSFITEGRWEKIVTALQPGDAVIIQFGHNDEKIEDPKRGTDPRTTFPENLRRFVRDVRAKGAAPILATPVCRRKFDATGKLVPTHGAYPDATRRVATEEKVPLLDLEKATATWLQAEGDEATKKYFMWIAPGQFPQIPEGKKDDTHFVAAGAEQVASLAVAQIRALRLPPADWLK